MMRKWVVGFAVLGFVANLAAHQSRAGNVEDFLKAQKKALTALHYDDFEVGDGWRVLCFDHTLNALGETASEAHCRIEAPGMRGPIMMVDKKGTRLVLFPPLAPCELTPPRAAVDGKQIQMLPIKAQIPILLAGNTFARSEQTAWPECDQQIDEVSLTQFGKAYDLMKIQWRKRGGK